MNESEEIEEEEEEEEEEEKGEAPSFFVSLSFIQSRGSFHSQQQSFR